jgi:hypothetical protein
MATGAVAETVAGSEVAVPWVAVATAAVAVSWAVLEAWEATAILGVAAGREAVARAAATEVQTAPRLSETRAL